MAECVAEVSRYLLELYRKDEITREEYLDTDFAHQLETIVRRRLTSRLAGDETTVMARDAARATVNRALQ